MTVCQLCPAGPLAMTGLPTCETCFGEVAAALDAVPGLLAGLQAATARTLARPAREAPGPPPAAGPRSPAHEAVIDLRADLYDTVRAWAAVVEPQGSADPARTLTRHLGVALAVPGGAVTAARLLRLVAAARYHLDPPEVTRVHEPCPSCGTRGLVRYDTGGPCWCTYCRTEVTAA